MRNSYVKGLGVTVAGVLILTPDALILKLAEGVGAFEGTFLRSVFMALGWAILVRLQKGAFFQPLMAVSRVGLLASVFLAFDILAFVAAVQSTTIANTLTIFAAVPAFAAVISFFLLKEKSGVGQIIAIVASFFGVVLIFNSGVGGESLFGNVMAVLAALLYALYIVCLRFSGRDEVVE